MDGIDWPRGLAFLCVIALILLGAYLRRNTVDGEADPYQSTPTRRSRGDRGWR